MKYNSSASHIGRQPLSDSTQSPSSPFTKLHHNGLFWGFVGVASFSLTVPMTRIAVNTGLTPQFTGLFRAVIAGILAILVLAITKQRIPQRRLWPRIAVVSLGCGIGFPLFTSLALVHAEAQHGALVIAFLPAATAAVSVLRTGHRPPWIFWAASIIGALLAVYSGSLSSSSPGSLSWSDLLLVAAVISAACGYAEGGLLAREIGAWQTICWALVVALPVTTILSVPTLFTMSPDVPLTGWLAFGYLATVSMFLGFFAWYRGLGIGPLVQVSQIQLTQPIMSLFFSALLLGEHLSPLTLTLSVAIIACAFTAVHSKN